MAIISCFPSGSGGGGGIALAAVSSITTLASSGKVYVKWIDPDDIIVSGATLAEWGGTLLVRKAGSYPASRIDGTIVLDSKERRTAATYEDDAYFCDSGLADGTVYYYKFFPYTTDFVYTVDDDDQFTKTPNPVEVGNVSGITAVAAGNGKLNLKWTDPAATVVQDGITLATWASTKVVYKTNGYPSSPEDGTLAINSTTRNAYTSTPLTISGLTNGTTYYIALFPISTDGAVNDNVENRITGMPDRIVIPTVPSQSGSLTYSGGTLTPTWSGYDSTKMTIGGTTSGVNAGSYTATFTPKSDYKWSDNTTAAKNVSWVIGRQAISTVPTQNGSLTYNGNAQSPSWNNYDSNKMTLGGTTSGTNAGSYNATFTPTSNYQWSDASTTAKTVVWSIGKLATTFATSPASIALNMSATSGTITITRAGNGRITASSNDTNVATVIVNNETGTSPTVTVNNVNQTNGNAVITINVAAGTNHTYTPSSTTCTVTANFVSTTLNDNSWATIRSVSAAGTGASFWAVGDRKSVLINGSIGVGLTLNNTYWTYIIGFNHNSTIEGNGIHFQGFKTAQSGGTDICLVDSYYNTNGGANKCFNMNHSTSSTNANGWEGCDLRYDILGSVNAKNQQNAAATTPTSPVAASLMATLPSDLRAQMQPMTKYTDNTGGGSDTASYVTSTTDYLPLLAEFEVFGTRSYANSAEKNYQAQYQYYINGNSKIKYKHNDTSTAANWWERSPGSSSSGNFCCVTSTGSADSRYSRYAYGLAPAFKI